ncbi:MAG: LD-carboxypeptidase [Oscillospiraceae bacterium]|nr:LD-carboxypeptidase [Oscillospiraceae bacterium]
MNPEDEIRIIAPSSSLTRVRPDIYDSALAFLQNQGFNVTFSKNCRETNIFQSSSVHSRVDDIHEAFADRNVKAVMACIGGFNANEILPYLDYELVKANPKILCGYSDITALLNAVYAKTGLVTYHAPHLAALGFLNEREYTQKYFSECMMNNESIVVTHSETAQGYIAIQEGKCEGEIIGGNLCTLNLLQGTPYMPDIKNKVLFLEDDNIMGDYFVCEFDRNLQSLLQIDGADTIRGIVFGRFDESCKMTEDIVKAIVKGKVSPDIPIVFGVDFGHVFPMISFPIGGRVSLLVNNRIELKIIEH